MAPTKQTEKSGSKEKKEMSGLKGEAAKPIKTAKTKETPLAAKVPEGESTPRTRSKKNIKVSEMDYPKDTGSAEAESSGATLTVAKKSRTKSDKDSTSKPSKSIGMISHSNVYSSKKRAREQPEAESEQTTSSKRKKGDPTAEKTTEKKAPIKKKVAKAPLVSLDDSEDDAAGEVEGEEGDEDVYLHGFSTDEDSSDEDGDAMNQDPLEVKNLPNKAKDDAEVKRRLDAATRKPTADRGVLYIGRIPHGFYEEQMKDYFSQFGNVTRLRLARNKKTGRSKHYGFIEFDSSSVAQIVSETMNNYLLAGHLLQCKLIATEKLHPELWVGANKKWKVIPKGRIARLAHNKTRTPAQQSRAEERLLKRQAEKEVKLKAAGVNYSLSKVGYTRISA